jgi:hypothetical protein
MTHAEPHLIDAKSKDELHHEYYWLADARNERQVLSQRGSYDDDPARTRRLQAQYQQRMKTEKWKSDCAQEGGVWAIRLQSSELPPIVAFRRHAPKKPLAHHLPLRLRSPILHIGKGREVYEVVSLMWREAIESVEPGIHEFHPLAIQFLDATYHHFVFRPMQFGDVVDLEKSDSELYQGQPYCLNASPTHITLKKSKMVEKNYIVHLRTHVFVSVQLAACLKPLLPVSNYLLPVDVA